MENVVRLIRSYDEPVAVVVSAMQGVTDQLADRRERDGIEAVHLAALPDANNSAALAAVHADLERDWDAPQDDARLIHGERAAAVLLAAHLEHTGIPAEAMDAAQAGVRCTGRPGHARPHPHIGASIRAAVQPVLDAGKVPVITGFYGDQDGQPTVFGRGGSDYVASLVAQALGANAVDLWKDVAGFLTADPRMVPEARLVPALDYQEGAELAYFGAKILHPRSVEPLAEAGIPMRVRSFNDSDAPGTIISDGAVMAPELVRSAASRGGLAILRLSGPDMGHTPGIARKVFTVLGDADVNVLNMANSQATFALLLEGADADRALAAVRSIVGSSIRDVELLRDRALVCVVGRGLGETPGSAARIMDAVASGGVNIDMISLGASEIAIDLVVPGSQREAALRGLHDTFLAGAA